MYIPMFSFGNFNYQTIFLKICEWDYCESFSSQSTRHLAFSFICNFSSENQNCFPTSHYSSSKAGTVTDWFFGSFYVLKVIECDNGGRYAAYHPYYHDNVSFRIPRLSWRRNAMFQWNITESCGRTRFMQWNESKRFEREDRISSSNRGWRQVKS